MRYATIVLLLFATACGDDTSHADASADVTVDQSRQCGSGSHPVLCPDDAAADVDKCPLITQVPDPSDPGTVPPRVADGGYYVGCRFIANDESMYIDGSCMTPVWTCEGTPPPAHWDQTWIPSTEDVSRRARTNRVHGDPSSDERARDPLTRASPVSTR